MKFLIDNALSPDIAIQLSSAGYDALHVRDLGMARAIDDDIFDLAAKDDRIVVSADTDFGTLLALRQELKPSIILFRGPGSRKADYLSQLILSNLSQLEADLTHGSIVTFEPGRIRIRHLPI
ncbi:MAG: DUF5615 family PIN-like protein [Gemmatales bacterium]